MKFLSISQTKILESSLALPANGRGGSVATSFNFAECKTWRDIVNDVRTILQETKEFIYIPDLQPHLAI